MLAQTAAPHRRSRPTCSQGLGNTAIVLRGAALRQHRRLPRIHRHHRAGDPARATQPHALRGDERARWRRSAWASAVPLGFNNSYALAMRAADAAALGIAHAERPGAAIPSCGWACRNEFIGRADGWPGLARALRPAAAARPALDHGLAYDAHRGQADRRDRHLHHRRQDRPPGPARAGGRPGLLPALRRGAAVPAGRAAALPAGLGRAAASSKAASTSAR